MIEAAEFDAKFDRGEDITGFLDFTFRSMSLWALQSFGGSTVRRYAFTHHLQAN
jgi:hypothetical protein